MDDVTKAAERLTGGREPPNCRHLYNAHGQCQWCHWDRKDIDAWAVARAYLAVAAERDALRAENAKLRAALAPCLTILRHKEIRPPMNPGVQEKLEAKVATALNSGIEHESI